MDELVEKDIHTLPEKYLKIAAKYVRTPAAAKKLALQIL